MRTRVRTSSLTLVAVVGIGVLTTCRSEAQTLDEAHRAAIADSISAFLDEYASRVARLDVEGLAGLYADDPRFRWVEDGQITYTSVEGIRQAVRRLSRSFDRAELHWDDVQVLPTGPGTATVSAGFRQIFAGAGGDEFALVGAMTATLIHTPDGWRFLVGHSSTLGGGGRPDTTSRPDGPENR